MTSSAVQTLQVVDNDLGGIITFLATNNTEQSLFLKLDIYGKNIPQQSWLREIDAGQSKDLGVVCTIEAGQPYTYKYLYTETPMSPFPNPPNISGPTYGIPFFIQLDKLNCGPTCIQMIHNYFEKESQNSSISVQRIAELGCCWPNTYSWPMELGLAATKMGYDVEVWGTKYLYRSENFEQSQAECESLKVPKNEQHIDLQNILDKMNETCLVITLLNWHKLLQLMVDPEDTSECKGYAGHYVCISGHDDENIYVHNQGKGDTCGQYSGPYVAIPRPTFEAARIHKTGEGVIFIKQGIAEN